MTYTYDLNHKHAVTALSNGNTYGYDANGNMTQRHVYENGAWKDYTLTYDAENHLTNVTGAATAQFTYNGDGQRVKSLENGTTKVYIGNYVEWNASTSTMKKYYYAGSTRVAMREGSDNPLWLLGDHLGSTNKVANYDGTWHGTQNYKAWGETRFVAGDIPTDFKFTGQREAPSIGLYDYGARWYDPSLGRFSQADTIIPEALRGVLAWDRYAYTLNNPTRFIDPSGHKPCDEEKGCDDTSETTTTPAPLPPPISPSTPTPTPPATPNPPNINQPPIFPPISTPPQPPTYSSQCTPEHPCIDSWGRPWWWNTNPQDPDYYVLAGNFGSAFGGTVMFIYDRYGNVYFALGGNVGKSLAKADFNLSGGWVGSKLDSSMPDEAGMISFLSGLAINAGAGIVGGGGVTWSPNAGKYVSHVAWEYGAHLPADIGVSIVYSWRLNFGFGYIH